MASAVFSEQQTVTEILNSIANLFTFFNQPYREKQLREGLTISVFGKADEYRGSLQMTNPVVDLIGDRTGRIVPIYPQSEEHGIKTWEFAGWVENALSRCEARGILDPLPENVIAENC